MKKNFLKDLLNIIVFTEDQEGVHPDNLHSADSCQGSLAEEELDRCTST